MLGIGGAPHEWDWPALRGAVIGHGSWRLAAVPNRYLADVAAAAAGHGLTARVVESGVVELTPTVGPQNNAVGPRLPRSRETRQQRPVAQKPTVLPERAVRPPGAVGGAVWTGGAKHYCPYCGRGGRRTMDAVEFARWQQEATARWEAKPQAERDEFCRAWRALEGLFTRQFPEAGERRKAMVWFFDLLFAREAARNQEVERESQGNG